MPNAMIAQWRLHTHQLSGTTSATPAEVVGRLGAVQAQDYPGALWTIGLRAHQATVATVEQAIAEGKIVRTWPMRGTLHFVSAADVRWMLALLTPRVIAGSRRRHAQLELDETTLGRGKELLVKALEGGKRLTRQELMAVLEQAGIATANQRGYHLLGWAAQTGLICFGPMQAKQPTFVLLDEWAPAAKALTREEALAAVTMRYFCGHGPATLADFMWWTGLLAADARAGLAMVSSQLVQEEHAGQRYWLGPEAANRPSLANRCSLLPGFDEYLLGYTDRSAVLDPHYSQRIQPGKNGIFSPTILYDGQVVGTWRRTFKKGQVVITTSPFIPFSAEQQQAVAAAADHYGRFIGVAASINHH